MSVNNTRVHVQNEHSIYIHIYEENKRRISYQRIRVFLSRIRFSTGSNVTVTGSK